ncbi:hypothetical protein [Asanoa siamensis]|uniref:MFS transporter n=1 Tax=Asanoa siamensis TaxID=926357 RepID=A0ABQ4D3T3_9ACTN|nr:hypothetical protein [Asanoa siamensis]GIF77918.1 hypothetical protein Asi02nite_74360 [Asanoa siamensis]
MAAIRAIPTIRDTMDVRRRERPDIPGVALATTGLVALVHGFTRAETDGWNAGWTLGSFVASAVLLGLGTGTAFLPAMSLATHGLRAHDAGIASAIINTSQQVGASIGTAPLNTVAASATAAWLLDHAGPTNQAIVHGYATAVWWAVGFLVVGASLAVTLVRVRRPAGTAAEPSDGPVGEPLLVH